MSEPANRLFSQQGKALPVLLSGPEKKRRYEELQPYLDGLLSDPHASPIALMSTTLSLLHNAFDTFFWSGFYRRVGEDLLEVGPNQGTVGCTMIRFGQGVCGTVAESGQTKIVRDVHAEPNHIGCDNASLSEIVVPMLINGQLAAVLDVDSHVKDAFDSIDQLYLEKFTNKLGEALSQRDLSGCVALPKQTTL